MQGKSFYLALHIILFTLALPSYLILQNMTQNLPLIPQALQDHQKVRYIIGPIFFFSNKSQLLIFLLFSTDEKDVPEALDPEKFVYCGDSDPIWVCCNAFVPGHHCTFAYCHNCNSDRVTPGRTETRKRKAETIENQCDHTDLTPFTDCTYLSRSYLLSCKDRGDRIPEKCVKCRRFFSGHRILKTVAV